MGKIARYLGALSDEQRDNVIEAEEFNNGMFFNAAGVGCLVGVAEREYFDNCGWDAFSPPVAFSMDYPDGGVGGQFDALCRKFGQPRIVAACKARAAKGNNISREALTEIRSEVYRKLVPVGGMNGRYPEDLR